MLPRLLLGFLIPDFCFLEISEAIPCRHLFPRAGVVRSTEDPSLNETMKTYKAISGNEFTDFPFPLVGEGCSFQQWRVGNKMPTLPNWRVLQATPILERGPDESGRLQHHPAPLLYFLRLVAFE